MRISNPTPDDHLAESPKVLAQDLKYAGVDISEDEAEKLRVISDRKFNRYDLFAPGETFQHRLIYWLDNFHKSDREAAMNIVRSLTFVSHKELRALSASTFGNAVSVIKSELENIPSDSAAAYLDARSKRVDSELSQSLFVAMADDVMLDYFRRHAQMECEDLTRDNFVEYYKLDKRCRTDLREHRRIFLIDQLSASGYTAIHRSGNGPGEWKGKLPTFANLWPEESTDCRLYYCPYIIATRAERSITGLIDEWCKDSGYDRPPLVIPAARTCVSPCLCATKPDEIEEESLVARLCRKYYDRFEPNDSEKKGGSCVYGFGEAGLTLVLSTNCPNNSLYLLWHSDNGWFPLFPRVKHHR